MAAYLIANDDHMLAGYRNSSPGIEQYHTSTQATAAYLYVPPDAALPPLYSQEETPDPIVRVKLFTPDSSWTWFLTEWDGTRIAFGLVVGFETELGYIDLDELSAIRGKRSGLPIERDIHFTPAPLSIVRARVEAA